MWPLVPTLVAAVLPTTIVAAYRDIELTASRSRTQLRGVVLLVLTGLSLAPSLVAMRFDLVVVWRNTSFLLGLALLSTTLLPGQAAWLPVCAVPMWMWLLGTAPGGQVEGWALLLQPSDSLMALIIAFVAFPVGGIAYWAIRAPRRSQVTVES